MYGSMHITRAMGPVEQTTSRLGGMLSTGDPSLTIMRRQFSAINADVTI